MERHSSRKLKQKIQSTIPAIMQIAGAFLSSIVGVIVGLFLYSFVRPYLEKKAQNLATHEDIDKVLDQVEAVTILMTCS